MAAALAIEASQEFRSLAPCELGMPRVSCLQKNARKVLKNDDDDDDDDEDDDNLATPRNMFNDLGFLQNNWRRHRALQMFLEQLPAA